MEFYGSIDLVSGSVTASVFSGSFKGNADGLYNIQASGVTGLNLSQIANGSNTASISTEGFNVDTDTSITGSLKVSGTITAEQYNVTVVSSSILYQSGSTKFGDSLDDRHELTGSVKITGSITLNGEAIGTGKLNETTFNSYVTASDSKLGNIETSTGSLNSFTSSIDTTIKSKLDSENIVSGSAQVNITGNTGYSTFSSSISTSIGDVNSTLSNLSSSVATTTSNLSGSINTLSGSIATTTNNLSGSIDSLSGSVATTTNNLSSSVNSLSGSVATTTSNLSGTITNLSSSVATTTNNLSSSVATTDLSQNNRLDTIEGRYATTGSNTFKGTQTLSGSIIPSVDNTYDLGSTTYQWRDVYISSGSLYIDGTKVLSSTNQELTFTTDTGQSFKILESTTDNITLQTADGDIELKTSADGDILLDPTNGKITLKGPVEILNGNKIQSSIGGTPVVFANDIVVSGSIDLTGTIEGIDLTIFSSSINTRVGNTETSVSSLNSLTSSVVSRIESLETESGSVRTTFNSYTSSANSRLSSIETTTGSIITTNTTQDGRLTSIESKTGSYATTGSNVFLGSQTITGSLYISQNLVVQGSSSIEYVTSSQLRVDDNVITLNTSTPGQRFGGIEVYDSGSANNATGSILWDSLNNRWIYQNSSDAGYGGGMFLSGPRSSGSLGSELTLTSGKIAKSAGGDHLNDSIINESGGGIGIGGNLVITGSIVASTTSLVSGSSQISFNGITDKPTLVSGSSQITFSGISSLPTLVSGSSQIDFTGIASKPTLVSGSSQISYTGLSNIPGGIVSGSAQVDLTSTTNYASGIKTRLDAVGVVSGSAQIDLTATTNYASGILTRLNAVGVFSGSAQVTGIGNAQLTNSSFNIGTTSISLGRASASQTLTGVSIDGNAATVSGGVYTTGDQTIAGVKTFSNKVVFNSAVANRPQLPGGMLGLDTGDGDFDIWGISRDYYPSHATAANAWGLRWNGANNDFEFVGGGTSRVILDMDGGNVTATGNVSATGTIGGSNYSGTHSGASSGTNTGDETLARINALAITTVGTITSGTWNGSSIGTSYTAAKVTSVNAGTGVGVDATTGAVTVSIGQAVGTGNSPTFANVNSSGNVIVNSGNNSTSASGGLTLWDSGGTTTSWIGFKSTSGSGWGTHGASSASYATYFVMDTVNRGWIFRYSTNGGTDFGNGTNVASISNTGTLTVNGNVMPNTNNSSNLGSASVGWANVYTNDLHLSNMNKPEGNDIDGTNGTWTIQEGAENLYIINNNNGKKYKIDLTEII